MIACILEKANIYELESKIQEFLNNKWKCQGGPFTYEKNNQLAFCQLMIKNKNKWSVLK